jgi:excisionase family DNA binding protein
MGASDVFTTGEAAKVCGVSQQTIIRSIDTGMLVGFKVPGSKFRRVKAVELRKFMRRHRLPLDRLPAEDRLILIVSPDRPRLKKDLRLFVPRYEVQYVDTFEAGLLVGDFRASVLIIDERVGKQILKSLIARLASMEPPVPYIVLGSSSVEESQEQHHLSRTHARQHLQYRVESLLR